ncbi:hypothetical protein [Embleya sp. AB8]|uniref:hypothetical protein n=1 Tax=Embleya sp. AB8 TaxID=3156304 RepID=UPI003C7724A9
MEHDISLEWDSGPTADLRPPTEVYASIGLPHPEPEAAAAAGPGAPIGTIRARQAGRLLGWVTLYGDGESRVGAQGERADRLARRLVRGAHVGDPPPSAEERAAAVGMYREAAEQARSAGARILHWSGTDTAPEGNAARALGARVTGEIARIWTVDPRTWWAPGGLPAVRVRALSAPRVGVIGEGAELTADVAGSRAYTNAAEAITAPGVTADILGAVLAELVELLRRTHPDVTELAVFEFDADPEGAVRHALPRAGLRIEHRLLDFELPLT